MKQNPIFALYRAQPPLTRVPCCRKSSVNDPGGLQLVTLAVGSIPQEGYGVAGNQTSSFNLTVTPEPKFLANGGALLLMDFDVTVLDTVAPFSATVTVDIEFEVSLDGSTWFTPTGVPDPVFSFSGTSTVTAAGFSSSCQAVCLPGPSFFRFKTTLTIASTSGLLFLLPSNITQIPL